MASPYEAALWQLREFRPVVVGGGPTGGLVKRTLGSDTVEGDIARGLFGVLPASLRETKMGRSAGSALGLDESGRGPGPSVHVYGILPLGGSEPVARYSWCQDARPEMPSVHRTPSRLGFVRDAAGELLHRVVAGPGEGETIAYVSASGAWWPGGAVIGTVELRKEIIKRGDVFTLTVTQEGLPPWSATGKRKKAETSPFEKALAVTDLLSGDSTGGDLRSVDFDFKSEYSAGFKARSSIDMVSINDPRVNRLVALAALLAAKGIGGVS